MKADIYFFKRWSSISVKILRIYDAIQSTTNENVQIYLREWAKDQHKIKIKEKKELTEYIHKTLNPPTL